MREQGYLLNNINNVNYKNIIKLHNRIISITFLLVDIIVFSLSYLVIRLPYMAGSFLIFQVGERRKNNCRPKRRLTGFYYWLCLLLSFNYSMAAIHSVDCFGKMSVLFL